MKKQNRALTITVAALISLTAANAHEEVYKIDPVHSTVNFSIRHFVAKATGSFNQFEGSIQVDTDDLSKSSVEATITVGSVDTANEMRDDHLNADDYFNTATFPVITFTSTKWESTDEETMFLVTGPLTMLGITKEVTLEVSLLGFGPGRNGAHLSGWEASTTIDRTEWGLTAGAPAVGNEVEVTINIEAVRQ